MVIASALVGCLLCWQPARARILLKPKGENALPLRTKALKADVTIEGQFATTELELTFANESGRRMEADLIYTLPEGAVARLPARRPDAGVPPPTASG